VVIGVPSWVAEEEEVRFADYMMVLDAQLEFGHRKMLVAAVEAVGLTVGGVDVVEFAVELAVMCSTRQVALLEELTGEAAMRTADVVVAAAVAVVHYDRIVFGPS
jgi:hypothetical protein